MTPERWHRIKEIFNAALDRAPDERALFVDSASGAPYWAGGAEPMAPVPAKMACDLRW